MFLTPQTVQHTLLWWEWGRGPVGSNCSSRAARPAGFYLEASPVRKHLPRLLCPPTCHRKTDLPRGSPSLRPAAPGLRRARRRQQTWGPSQPPRKASRMAAGSQGDPLRGTGFCRTFQRTLTNAGQLSLLTEGTSWRKHRELLPPPRRRQEANTVRTNPKSKQATSQCPRNAPFLWEISSHNSFLD